MREKIREAIFGAISQKWPEIKLKPEEIKIDYPPQGMGDYSCNVAMRLTKNLKKNPLEIAEEIAKSINPPRSPFIKGGGLERVEAVAPGFLNFYLSDEACVANVLKIIKGKGGYGRCKVGEGKKIMVEFGQPNTHKAFHVGHLRSAISGLSVAKLHEALGYEVIKVNYYGDIGMHVAKATWGMKQNGLPEEFDAWDTRAKMELIDEMYVKGSRAFLEDPKAEKEIRQINKDIYNKKENENVALYLKLRDWSLEQLATVFKSLGVEYDRQYPESEVYERAVTVVKENIGKIFEESQGAVVYNGEKDGLTTWVFLTKEGNPTYSAKDLALAEKKFNEYDLDFSIVTTSVEQSDYFKTVIHCLERLKPELGGKYQHVPFGWLLRENKKTSSRMGDTVKGVDIIEEAERVAEEKISLESDYDEKTRGVITKRVAMAGLKFMILSHEFHNNINYDPAEFIKLKGFSGPFILYSYVRTQAILRKATDGNGAEDGNAVSLETDEERKLAGKLLIFPEVVLRAGEEISPHIVCTYLYELAGDFNSFYEKCPIQKAESRRVKNSRLMLTVAVGQVLKNGLELLGIDVLDRM